MKRSQRHEEEDDLVADPKTLFLSWNTLSFIKTPPPAFLHRAAILVIALLIGLATYSSFTDVENTIRLDGQILIENPREIIATRSDYIEAVDFSDGASFKKGQVLGRFQSGELLTAPIEGTLLRKFVTNGSYLKAGASVGLIAPSGGRWIFSGKVGNEVFFKFKKGANTKVKLAFDAGAELGILSGSVFDWSGSPDYPEKSIEILVSLAPDSKQLNWLNANGSKVYGAAADAWIIVSKKNALMAAKEALFEK